MADKELLRKVGSMQQEAYIRPCRMEDGRSDGMKAFQVKNKRLEMLLMADKCLDIAQLIYRGENFSFLAKPGLCGRNHYDTNGAEAQRSIMGGMLFTCGLENIGAPCEVDGKSYPMHGRIRTTPAEQVCYYSEWRENTYHMEISGQMREAELFGENLVLHRTIETTYPEKKILITDKITNEGLREEACLLLYHFNLGYPLLDVDCEVILPSLCIEARDEGSIKEISFAHGMDRPVDHKLEDVFFHELAADEDGNTFAAIVNTSLGIGLKIGFSKKVLPYFMQWKSLASGDYVMGFEPANASVYGRSYHNDKKDYCKLKPYETIEYCLTLELLDEVDFAKVREEKHKLCEQKKKGDFYEKI